jgi:molybdopterin/thiamine biosynthesis adenylyltransferase
MFFARAGRAGIDSRADRAPELAPLSEAKICVFGLGCLGAPSTLEFARCGVKELQIVDPDFVDPAASGRWPLGLHVAGLSKAKALVEFIRQHYPYTKVMDHPFAVGGVRDLRDPGDSAQTIMKRITEGASLIYDATAEVGVQHYLSDYARELRIPYVAVEGTHGGWGGLVMRVVPGETAGCWMCLQTYLYDPKPPHIELPPNSPTGTVQPIGCADPTFTGAGFDLAQVALTGVRTAVSTICGSVPNGYPPQDWDVTIISLRDKQGNLIPPTFDKFNLDRHPECPRCNQT